MTNANTERSLLWKALKADGWVPENVAVGVRPPKGTRPLPKALDIASVDALLATPDLTPAAGWRSIRGK